MPDVFYEGNAVIVRMTFEVEGVPTDPTTVLFRVRMPDDTVTTYTFPAAEITNPEVGVYELTLPGTLDPFTYYGRVEGTGAVVAADEFQFTILPSPTFDDVGPVLGPCGAWTSAEDVALCAGVEISSMNQELLEWVATEASMVLYPLTAYKYSGQCSHEARPCRRRRMCFNDWGMWDDEAGYACGCGLLSQVTLPGYPVTSVTEVVIDGDVVDPDTYQLERDWTTLTRTREPGYPDTRLWWPACQNMDEKDLTLPGTWVVRYLGGINPPPLGMRAAAELGAELLRACPGSGASGECKLPAGVTSITRQGVSMDFSGFRSFAFDRSLGAWNTGLRLVDSFLNVDNPTGRKLPSAFFSPDAPFYAEQTAT